MEPARAETMIIENARIYTMDRDLPVVEALAWRDGRIVAVGDRGSVGQVRRVDLGGRAVIPGLIDAHIHFLSYSRSLTRIELDGVRSKEEAVAMVAARAREVGPGRWILGGGWNNNLWSPPDFPTREEIDRAAPGNPVLLDRKDLHSCWVNSAALRLAGIARDTPDPPGAAIGRDVDGEPDGMLYESAVRLAREAVDEPPPDDVAVMRRGMKLLASMGITGIHDCEGPDAFRALQEIEAAGELGLRVVMLLPYGGLNEAIRLGMRTGFGSDRLAIGPVKIFSDGSLGSRTAEMLEPYEGEADYRGIGTIPQEEMEEAVARAAAAGIPSAIHAIGDAANRRVLDAFRKAREAEEARPGGPLLHRIEHVQLLHPDDIPRFASLGVVASMQPLHATSDMHAADRLWGRRARYGYAWRSLLDAGALVAFGSDAPVETPNPFAGIHAAVTRQDGESLPEGGWYPEERLSVEEAVRAYTESAARSAPYLRGVRGTLTMGSAADLLVLDRDIFAIPPSEIKDARPLVTLVGGRATYDPGGLFAS
jgi:predicted amidohydrolase YtcJ